MLHRRLALVPLLAVLLVGPALAETLALPPNLVGAASDAGQALLVEAEARAAYFPLADNFVTQKTQSFCGVASMTMVFNAMAIPAPAVPEYAPYTTFTQDNVLDEKTETVIPRATIEKMGMTLDQLGAAIATKPVDATIRHAGDTSLGAFRTEVRDYLAQKDHFVMVNYLRKAMGQETGGHISPLAAYDAEADRFLILDVARYKYPPVWVTAADLFDAMNTPDKDNGDKTRGYVLVKKKGG